MGRKKNKVESDVVNTVEVEEVVETSYNHVPGTTHVNAFVAAVNLAQEKVDKAQAELETAQRELEEKLNS